MVKRYGPWKDRGGWSSAMDEEKDGAYVKHSDYAKLEAELRDAVVLLATANPGEDLPDQESADLWCTAVSKFLLKHEHLVIYAQRQGRDNG
ncbi:MAG TPA: hypothetical protein VN879_15980 [Candidatus Acidoferrales bacterium]|nr:hypothetical protein [Candidatus Acidoferrales bacterium]